MTEALREAMAYSLGLERARANAKEAKEAAEAALKFALKMQQEACRAESRWRDDPLERPWSFENEQPGRAADHAWNEFNAYAADAVAAAVHMEEARAALDAALKRWAGTE